MFDESFKKYKNTVEYPKQRIQAVPKPKLQGFPNHTEFGIAMDQYEKDIIVYDFKRKKMMVAHQEEESKMRSLFFVDLMDDFGWDELSDDKQSMIKDHIWEEGHAEGFSGCLNEAWEIQPLINVLIK